MVNNTHTIALFSQSMAGGGAERVVANLTQSLVQRGLSVHLLLARAHGQMLVDIPPSIRIVDFGQNHVICTLPYLLNYVHTERPAILISFLTHANLVALWAVHLAHTQTKVIVSDHIVVSRHAEATPGVKEDLLPRLARIFYRRANAIIAVSQGVADDLVNNIGVSRNKTHVIYNPIVTPALLEKMQIVPSHPWFVPGTPPVVLAVGRLTAQKDYPALLRTFALARQEREMHLLILGEGEKRFELEGMVRSLGLENDVQMPGFVSNPYVYMARASVFVLSSAWEGLPSVLIEALACGAPIVSTDCPSGPAEILENGKYGKLVPVGDPDAMARAILATLDSIPDRRLLQQRAQVFSLETVTSQYIDLFESLLGACECR
jgi:glycosyltransferase involved in cell wall biosynthesis